MGHDTKTLLDGADRPFYLANMAVSSDDVETDRREEITDTVKFVVAVNVGNCETTLLVHVNNSFEFGFNSQVTAIGDGDNGSVVEIARNCVKEAMVLNKEKIDAERDVGVLFQDGGGQWDGRERRRPDGGSGTSHLAFEGSYVGAVDVEGTECVVCGDWTVDDEIVVEQVPEKNFVRTAQHAIKFSSSISLLNLALREWFFIGLDRGK